MNTRRNFLASGGVAAFGGLLPLAPAWAQGYPDRPVRVIVGYPPGGAIDATARLVADGMGRRLGQTLIVDNRAGANGMIGLEAVSRAEADGYTLAVAGASNVSAGPHLQPVRFDPLAMTYVTCLVKAPLTLAVKTGFPAKTVSEFIEYAKKNEVTYGSAGVGSSHHLTGELFRLRTGTKLVHVPYKGSGPMFGDLMAGVIDASFGDPTLVTMAHSGKVRALGASSNGQWKINPDVPPITNTVSGFVAENWYGLLAPAKIPQAIVDQLYREATATLSDPKVIKTFADQGLECAPMEPAAFKEYVKRDSGVWASVIKDANIQI